MAKVMDGSGELPRGTEHILLVEDDELLRALERRILEQQGYTVVSARDGIEAIALAGQGHLRIDLLVTDVVMPGMIGPDVAVTLRSRWPRLRVLYISGFTGGALDSQSAAGERVDLLPKPFTPDELAHRVREALDGGASRTQVAG